MRALRQLACVLALSIGISSVALADPFDQIRWLIGAKRNADAIAELDKGEVDVNTQTSEGYTLLHYAANDTNLPMVKELLRRGANPNLRSNSGTLPVDMAYGTMMIAELKKAMQAAANPGSPAPATNEGGADFDKIRSHIGARRNADAIAELDKGIDINMQTGEGYSLLHYAANDANLEMVKELLRRGANPNLRSATGHTALDMGYGTMLLAELKKAGGVSGLNPPAVAQPQAAARPAAANPPAQPAPVRRDPPAKKTAESPHAELCAQRHYSSSALCSDSTCKMREYRKWQTCLKTGSYY